jgi:two-component sensor histidine kinase
VKSEFLANVTHELRTPLNSVLGMADLAHGLASDKRQREYLGILKSSAENLFGLITSILDLSRIESGHLALSPADVDLHQLLESVVESFALEAQNKGLSLEFALDPETPAVVHGDRVRLAQIVTNLVANAVKYTDSGRVTVSVSPGVRISVVDTGPGIPAGQHEAVFQPFTQLDGGPTRAHGGAGIGLAVARELAELMGGRIDLDSAEGRGSTFRVEVPLEVVAEPRDRTPKDAPSPVAKRAVLVGAPGPTRDSLAAWARSIGVEVSAVAAAELSSVPEPGTVDLVLVPGQEPGISRREISEAFPRATVWTSGVLGSAATEDDAQRVLSRPVMPSTFVRLLCEHSGGNASPEAGSGGPVDAGQTTEEAARALVERFAPDALEAHHLDDLAAAARRAREDSEGLGGRVEEMLFRLTLAARRGDLDGSRELLSKIGGGGGRIGQTTQLHYNVER